MDKERADMDPKQVLKNPKHLRDPKEILREILGPELGEQIVEAIETLVEEKVAIVARKAFGGAWPNMGVFQPRRGWRLPKLRTWPGERRSLA